MRISIYSYVGQEPVLFSGSIADNIAYGLDPAVVKEADFQLFEHAHGKHQGEGAEAKRKALRERIEAAAKQANAHDFIASLPEVCIVIFRDVGIVAIPHAV